jgi:tryptophan synthase alpha chain
MNRIDRIFLELREQRRSALMPYLPLGFPSLDKSRWLIRVAEEAGADMLELGIPFSDPLADGPVIQSASRVALKSGMTLAKCLEMVRDAREFGVKIPLILMGYYNPILRFGIDKCVRAAQTAGVDGLIIPDLPPEEAGTLDSACRACNLDLIFLAAPTSTRDRLIHIAAATFGFLYLVSVIGITGARDEISPGLPEFVARVRDITNKPVCVGFGISNAESARRVAGYADGVIVGSALVSKIGAEDEAIENARSFISELRAAI